MKSAGTSPPCRSAGCGEPDSLVGGTKKDRAVERPSHHGTAAGDPCKSAHSAGLQAQFWVSLLKSPQVFAESWGEAATLATGAQLSYNSLNLPWGCEFPHQAPELRA